MLHVHAPYTYVRTYKRRGENLQRIRRGRLCNPTKIYASAGYKLPLIRKSINFSRRLIYFPTRARARAKPTSKSRNLLLLPRSLAGHRFDDLWLGNLSAQACAYTYKQETKVAARRVLIVLVEHSAEGNEETRATGGRRDVWRVVVAVLGRRRKNLVPL